VINSNITLTDVTPGADPIPVMSDNCFVNAEETVADQFATHFEYVKNFAKAYCVCRFASFAIVSLQTRLFLLNCPQRLISLSRIVSFITKNRILFVKDLSTKSSLITSNIAGNAPL